MTQDAPVEVPDEPAGHPLRGAVRTLGRAQVRDILLLCVADGLVGASFGAITVAAGMPWWYPTLLSVVVFAGAGQFLVVGVLAAGGSPVAAAAAAILVNARHIPFGFAVRDAVGSGLLRRLVGTHVMIDESVAWALAQPTPARRRAAFWLCGSLLFVFWNVGVGLGALGGSALTDTSALGLDAAFPAVLLALVMPSLRQRRTRRAAVAGAGVAVASTPLLPAGLPVLLALAGLAARGRARTAGLDAAGRPTTETTTDGPATAGPTAPGSAADDDALGGSS